MYGSQTNKVHPRVCWWAACFCWFWSTQTGLRSLRWYCEETQDSVRLIIQNPGGSAEQKPSVTSSSRVSQLLCWVSVCAGSRPLRLRPRRLQAPSRTGGASPAASGTNAAWNGSADPQSRSWSLNPAGTSFPPSSDGHILGDHHHHHQAQLKV